MNLDLNDLGFMIAILLALIILAFILYIPVAAYLAAAAKAGKVVAEGVFDHAEYTRSDCIVHFDDGRTCVLDNCQPNWNIPRGTKVRIRCTGAWQYVAEET